MAVRGGEQKNSVLASNIDSAEEWWSASRVDRNVDTFARGDFTHSFFQIFVFDIDRLSVAQGQPRFRVASHHGPGRRR